jgi:hypothetical protein
MKVTARIQAIVFGLMFTLLSSTFLFNVLRVQDSHVKAVGLSLPAVIKSTELQSKQAVVPGKNGQPSKQTVYEGRVSYTYNVGQKAFEASNWEGYNGWTPYKEAAESIIAPYKTGQTYKVWVNPTDPSKAILGQQLDLAVYGVALMLSFILLLGSEIILMGVIGIGENAQANLVQELIFDLPVLLWTGFISSEFFQYYSLSSPPFSEWSYALVGIALLLGAVALYARLVSHKILPSRAGATKKPYVYINSNQSSGEIGR